MIGICSCCGLYAALGPQEVDILEPQIEQALSTDEKLLRLPKAELIKRLKQRRESDPSLCIGCLLVGCDGMQPCRLVAVAQDRAFSDLSEPVDFPLDSVLTNESIGTWLQLSDVTWYKVINQPFGTLVCEVRESPSSTGYTARVIIADPSTGSRISEMETLDEISFAEAQAECDSLVEVMIENGGPLVKSFSVAIDSLVAREQG